MNTDFDYADTLRAKSDQLNADDLVAGPITVEITAVGKGDPDQPLILSLSGGYQPWKPCKTMRRLMAAATGTSSAGALVGRWITLYRDPTVKWAGREEGGIRLSHMSGLDRTVTTRLQISRGKRAPYRVEPLRPQQAQAPAADLDDVLADAELVIADVDRWRADHGKGPVAEMTDTQRGQFAAWLAGHPAKFDEIRALIPDDNEISA